MLVSNIKFENFGGGQRHISAPYTDILIPAYSTGDNAVTGQIPSDIVDNVLAAFAARCPMVAIEILGNEDDGRETDLVDNTVVLRIPTIDGEEISFIDGGEL